MKLVKPSVEILYCDPYFLNLIEQAGRTCYKSEDKITKDSYKVFIKNLLRRGHESPIEFGVLVVKLITDRAIANELVRHRLCSFCQECVTGDTVVKVAKGKKYTIKYLYERQHGSCYDKTHNKTIQLKSACVKSGKVIPNKFVDVFYKGKYPVYKLTTKLGYTIKATDTHKFLCKDKTFKQLKDLKVGDSIYVNGKSSLDRLSDAELVRCYEDLQMCPQEISDEYNICYRTIINRLKKLGIFIPRKNDKNKEKYYKNYTRESYEKMRQTILKQYQEGRVPWNKGLRENDHPSVKKQAETLRKYHWNGQPGELSPSWKGGVSRRIAYRLKSDIKKCELCGSTKKLEVHHIDGNPENNKKSNLIKVCCKCHNLLHHGWHIGTNIILDEIVSIEYVGIEEVYDLEMKSPYNNYIANGFVVHNSTRYVDYNKKGIEIIVPFWYSNIWNNIDKINEGLRTGWDISEIGISCGLTEEEKDFLKGLQTAEKLYSKLVGVYRQKPEQARAVLPHCLKTEIVMGANFREWRHIFRLRMNRKAHLQMQEVMVELYNKLRLTYPEIFDIMFKDINNKEAV